MLVLFKKYLQGRCYLEALNPTTGNTVIPLVILISLVTLGFFLRSLQCLLKAHVIYLP